MSLPPWREQGKAERAASWIDRHPAGTLGFLLLFYFVLVLFQGHLKLLWADELITLSIASQPGAAGIWRALVSGADPNPPLIHLLVRTSTGLLGLESSAVRLPSLLCVLATLLGLWAMLRRWARPIFALAGVLAFMATRGFDYAYDARSYAPLMGFTVIALALWMSIPRALGWRRAGFCAGMALALAAAVSSNYYGVLACLPIAAGECSAMRISNKIRPGVWLGIGLGMLPLAGYLPLIRHNLAEFGPHAWNPPRIGMVASSYLELVEGIFWPVLFLAAYAVVRRRHVPWPMPRPEFVAMTVLLLYPLFGYGLARAGSAMISPRCVVPVCCGFGLAAGVLCRQVFERSSRAGLAVVLFLVAWVSVREAVCAQLLLRQRRAFLALRDEIQRDARGRILVADSAFVLPLSFYSDQKVRSRIVVPIDFAAIHRYEADDSGEQNLWAGREAVFPFPVIPFQLLGGLRATDLVVARPDGWLARDFEASGLHLAPVASQQEFWDQLGGVFTPLGHAETRELRPSRSGAEDRSRAEDR